jgi:hypothetical protein
MLLGTKVQVRIDTAPPTAQLYLDGALVSESPTMQITCKASDAEFDDGVLILDIPEARWPSGAVTPQTRRTIPLRQKHHTIQIYHPDPLSIEGAYDQQPCHLVDVTYHSEPDYALVVNKQSNLGRTPVVCSYSYSLEDFKKGTLTVASLQAVWPSGSTTESGPLTLDLAHPAYDHTFIRPDDPGREQDLQAVWQIKEQERAIAADRAQQRQLEKHHRLMEELERERIRLEKERLKLLRRTLEQQNSAREKHEQDRDDDR